MNYYRRYVGDYLKKTARLSVLEHGAYNLLLDYYYSDEKPLPLDRDELYTMVRAMTPADRKAVDKVLDRYFDAAVDGYHNHRADHEIEVSQKARDNGKQGGRPPTGKEPEHKPELEPEPKPLEITGLVTGSITEDGGGSGHPLALSLKPLTSNHQPPEKTHTARKARAHFGVENLVALGVDEQTAVDWLTVRKAKNGPLTQTALDELQREAGKAGISIAEAVLICARKNWRGFNASWDWRDSLPKKTAAQLIDEAEAERKRQTEQHREAA